MRHPRIIHRFIITVILSKQLCSKKALPVSETVNFITAIIILFCIGLTGATEQDSVIAKVEPDTPAEKAGLQAGDKIVKLNGYKIDSWSYLSIVSLLKNDSNVYTYEIEHPDGRIETYEITPMDAWYFIFYR